jgi:hypothetical protein
MSHFSEVTIDTGNELYGKVDTLEINAQCGVPWTYTSLLNGQRARTPTYISDLSFFCAWVVGEEVILAAYLVLMDPL